MSPDTLTHQLFWQQARTSAQQQYTQTELFKKKEKKKKVFQIIVKFVIKYH